MKRLLLVVVTSILFTIGAWHTGHGAWIYLKAELAQYLLERAWARTLKGQQCIVPWPWADTWPVARMLVPQHGVDLIVLAGTSGRTLAFGPGHASSSVIPGNDGTAILNGHRDTHFKFLEKVRPGDDIVIERNNGRNTRFTVYDMKIVDARHTLILHDESQPQIVLVTCYPFDAITPGGPLRYVVSGELHTSQS